MKLHTLFVSHNREEMTIKNIKRCEIARTHALRNIDALDYTDCTIWVTTEQEKVFFDKQLKNYKWINTVIVKDYIKKAPLLMSTHLQNTDADLFHITWDDHGVYEDCYTHAINAMLKRFPKQTIHQPSMSFSGVIGINIVNYPKQWPWQSGYGATHLIGSGIIKSFADWSNGRPIFCPDYKRVVWECEFSAYIRFHNALWYCPEAKIDHWRPDVSGELDKSHVEGRQDGSMTRDRLMHQERRRRGYYWGLNFDLVDNLEEALKLRNYDDADAPNKLLTTLRKTLKLDSVREEEEV